MSMADIKSVILVGGSSRVPMVQAAIKSLVGEDRIAVNVNADEAAVMGAALYGAGISRQFKTKDVRIHNVSPHSIAASYNVTKPVDQADPTSAQAMATKTVTTTLFPVGSKVGGKKVIKMKKADDFSVQLNYINQPSYFPNSILNVTIHGISAALLNYTNVTGHTVPLKNTTVKLVVGLDDSELIVVPEATLIFPTETSPTNEGTIANKIAGFFGGSNKEEADEAIEEVATDDDSSKTESKENPTSKGGQSEVEKAKEALKAENADTASKKQKVENMTIKLTVTRQTLGIQPMSTNDRIASGKFLRELKAAETRKRNREEARNALEAYTYKLRDRLEQEVFQLHSTEQEINDLKSARNEISDWLNDWAEQAPLKELKEKRQKLEKMENPIQKRITETKERPAVLERFNATLVTAQSTQMLLKPISEEDTKDPMAKYTEEEIKGFGEMIKTQTEWFEEISRKVADLEPRQDPPATIQDLESRQKMIQAEITKLIQKKAPKRKVKSAPDQQPYSTKPSAADANKTGEDSSSNPPPPTTPDSQSSSSGDDGPVKAEGTHSKDEL